MSEWFKWLLVALFVLRAVGDVTQIAGYVPKPSKPTTCAIAAIANTFTALGVAVIF